MAYNGLFVWLVADGWCWFVLRKKYCWLVAGGWFVLREKYCWLVTDKPSEQAVSCGESTNEDSIEPMVSLSFAATIFLNKKKTYYFV
jgi:hypothetical protein